MLGNWWRRSAARVPCQLLEHKNLVPWNGRLREKFLFFETGFVVQFGVHGDREPQNHSSLLGHLREKALARAVFFSLAFNVTARTAYVQDQVCSSLSRHFLTNFCLKCSGHLLVDCFGTCLDKEKLINSRKKEVFLVIYGDTQFRQLTLLNLNLDELPIHQICTNLIN